MNAESRNSVPELDVIQRWMQAVITNPDGVADGVASDAAQLLIPIAPNAIEDLILPSQRCDSIQRLSVYSNAYSARLIECLAGEFPALNHALGEETFNDFAITYLHDFPSTSYTLGKLSRHFIDFLVEAREPREAGEEPEWPDFLIDLARIESIYSEVFDGPGEEQIELLTAKTLRKIHPEDWGGIRFQFVDSFRLAQFEFPVHTYVTAVRKQETPAPPDPAQTYLAISRREFIVRRQELSVQQFILLEQLLAGLPLEIAIESTLQVIDTEITGFAQELQSWFAQWTAAGWFRGFF